ncbi:MAG: hypothetical protein KKA81_15660 [Bacteroidetes bacterium]|nr:hypothetical protein [Bacteroidota bacterium]
MRTKSFFQLSGLVALLLLIISGCGSNIKSELVGTWKVADVITDIDTASIRPEALESVLENYRSVHFEFYENNSMSIVTSGNSYSGGWLYDDSERMIKIRFDNSSNPEYSPLGILEDGRITNINNTGIGVITVIYEKAELQE